MLTILLEFGVADHNIMNTAVITLPHFSLLNAFNNQNVSLNSTAECTRYITGIIVKIWHQSYHSLHITRLRKCPITDEIKMLRSVWQDPYLVYFWHFLNNSLTGCHI